MFSGTSHSLYSLWGFVIFEKIKEYSIGFTNKENLIQENRGHLSNYLKVEKRQLTLNTAVETSSRSAARDCDFPTVSKSCFWRPCLINPSISSCASVPPSGRLPWFLAACRLLSAPRCSPESGGETVGIGITEVALHCASHSSWGWPHQHQHHAFNCRGAGMPALSLPCYPSKAELGHFILLHSTFCSALFTSFWFSPLFIFALLPGPPPLALHFYLSLILVLMLAVLCLIFLIVQCFLVHLYQVICACLMPPGTSISTVSENFVDASIELPSWCGSSLHEFLVSFLGWSHFFC